MSDKKTTLAEIQAAVKAPKGNFNKFGNYKYRSAEDILEAVKLVINPLGFWVEITDEIIHIGDRFYVKANVTLTNGKEVYTTSAFAREEDIKKGMDGSQITGAASSYARKYALNGLFAIDDTKDADATNEHADEVGNDLRNRLLNLIDTSSYDHDKQEKLKARVPAITTMAQYDSSLKILEANQLGIDGVSNPSQKEINKHLKTTL